LTDGSWRTLGEDCGGRPRGWVDERWLIIEALIDTTTGEQRELLASPERSISNPRLSPDRRWVAFDASRPGEPAHVGVAPFRDQLIPESEWVEVAGAASHPFWSADGRRLYYMPLGTNSMFRSSVRACHLDADGRVDGESMAAFASTEMMMPAYLPGTSPVATADRMVLALGDFRGDVWIMDLD
jgi:Tol biopolymer transport system component